MESSGGHRARARAPLLSRPFWAKDLTGWRATGQGALVLAGPAGVDAGHEWVAGLIQATHPRRNWQGVS